MECACPCADQPTDIGSAPHPEQKISCSKNSHSMRIFRRPWKASHQVNFIAEWVMKSFLFPELFGVQNCGEEIRTCVVKKKRGGDSQSSSGCLLSCTSRGPRPNSPLRTQCRRPSLSGWGVAGSAFSPSCSSTPSCLKCQMFTLLTKFRSLKTFAECIFIKGSWHYAMLQARLKSRACSCWKMASIIF